MASGASWMSRSRASASLSTRSAREMRTKTARTDSPRPEPSSPSAAARSTNASIARSNGLSARSSAGTTDERPVVPKPGWLMRSRDEMSGIASFGSTNCAHAESTASTSGSMLASASVRTSRASGRLAAETSITSTGSHEPSRTRASSARASAAVSMR
jgi:hypothetical protein